MRLRFSQVCLLDVVKQIATVHIFSHHHCPVGHFEVGVEADDVGMGQSTPVDHFSVEKLVDNFRWDSAPIDQFDGFLDSIRTPFEQIHFGVSA